jgi:hypothetical protein
MSKITIAALITFVALFTIQGINLGQNPPAQEKPKVMPDTTKLADEWMKRMNALDDWSLSPEGNEVGLEDVINSMMELYTPDVLAEVPPHDEEQIGSVMLRGAPLLRQWVEKIARSQVRLNYIRIAQTMKDFNGVRPIFFTELPWGGYGISFQIIGAWSLREDRLNKRYMAPGSIFLQYNDEGKIYRMRLYLTEITRVVAG